MRINDWLPKSIQCLKGYNRQRFLGDAVAGITVALVALPLAMAFAIASGLSPQAGIYTAIIAGFLISALGGSSTQIGGPTGAFVVVVYGIVARHGLDGLYMCTLMAGDRPRHGGEVYTPASRRRIYEWNRRHYWQHTDQGFLWAQTRESPGRLFGALGSSLPQFQLSLARSNVSRCARALADNSVLALRKKSSRLRRGPFCGHGHRRDFQAPGRNDRDPIRGNSFRLAEIADTAVSARSIANSDFTGRDRRHAGGDRIADVRRGFGPYER